MNKKNLALKLISSLLLVTLFAGCNPETKNSSIEDAQYIEARSILSAVNITYVFTPSVDPSPKTFIFPQVTVTPATIREYVEVQLNIQDTIPETITVAEDVMLEYYLVDQNDSGSQCYLGSVNHINLEVGSQTFNDVLYIPPECPLGSYMLFVDANRATPTAQVINKTDYNNTVTNVNKVTKAAGSAVSLLTLADFNSTNRGGSRMLGQHTINLVPLDTYNPTQGTVLANAEFKTDKARLINYGEDNPAIVTDVVLTIISQTQTPGNVLSVSGATNGYDINISSTNLDTLPPGEIKYKLISMTLQGTAKANATKGIQLAAGNDITGELQFQYLDSAPLLVKWTKLEQEAAAAAAAAAAAQLKNLQANTPEYGWSTSISEGSYDTYFGAGFDANASAKFDVTGVTASVNGKVDLKIFSDNLDLIDIDLNAGIAPDSFANTQYNLNITYLGSHQYAKSQNLETVLGKSSSTSSTIQKRVFENNVTINENGSKSKISNSKDWNVTKKADSHDTFDVVFVPVTIEAGAQATISLNLDIALKGITDIKFDVAPSVSIGGFVNGGVGFTFLEAGVQGVFTFIKDTVTGSVIASIELVPNSTGTGIASLKTILEEKIVNDVNLLDGKVQLFATYPVINWCKAWFVPYPCNISEKTVTDTLLNFDVDNKNYTLLDEEQTLFTINF
ncbi:MAG: hypothetical protein GQ570_09410 [Helicobacteraceae bacterium]|nr:hypothetical protein [Helicobacteraceae bacterium]